MGATIRDILSAKEADAIARERRFAGHKRILCGAPHPTIRGWRCTRDAGHGGLVHWGIQRNGGYTNAVEWPRDSRV